MELEVKKLNALKKYTGSFNFEYTPDSDLSLVPLCSVDGTVKVSGEYEIFEDDSVEIALTVKYLLKGQCSYCLEDAKKEVVFETDVLFLKENDGENYYYDGIKLNLKPAVDDAILISQPNVLLCKEDCKGIDVT
ncbi:MAG: hypothetical protein HDQ88_02570 [Clostridia bacterium]|nr:hypothetical protein [Clostridia bacterium]